MKILYIFLPLLFSIVFSQVKIFPDKFTIGAPKNSTVTIYIGEFDEKACRYYYYPVTVKYGTKSVLYKNKTIDIEWRYSPVIKIEPDVSTIFFPCKVIGINITNPFTIPKTEGKINLSELKYYIIGAIVVIAIIIYFVLKRIIL